MSPSIVVLNSINVLNSISKTFLNKYNLMSTFHVIQTYLF